MTGKAQDARSTLTKNSNGDIGDCYPRGIKGNMENLERRKELIKVWHLEQEDILDKIRTEKAVKKLENEWSPQQKAIQALVVN